MKPISTMLLTVEGGKFRAYAGTRAGTWKKLDHNRYEFDTPEEFKQWWIDNVNDPASVFASSSIDFPEEEGLTQDEVTAFLSIIGLMRGMSRDFGPRPMQSPIFGPQ